MLLGGLLPVIVYSVVEEVYGVVWGLVFGMVFGVGEITWEWIRYRKVDTITWVGNGLLLVMGGVSLLTQDGVWFKLQPAILEIGTAAFLIGSCLMGRPLLVLLAEKQGTLAKVSDNLRPRFLVFLRGVSVRLGIFFLVHAGLAVWAALEWSTRNWAILKGVGLTVSMLVYMGLEFWWFRRGLQKRNV